MVEGEIAAASAFDWGSIAALGGLLISIVVGAIRLGNAESQIRANSEDLTEMKTDLKRLKDDVLPHDANTNAEINSIKERLQRLEDNRPRNRGQ